MKKKLLLMITILCSLSVFAKTIIVTDIDDTIKMSGIKVSVWHMISTAFSTKNYFLGMPEILKGLETLDKDTQIVYLSNAKKWLSNAAHRELLENGQFPKGTLALRQKLSSADHKISYLRNLVKTQKPDTMILIGDIGQHDAKAYQTIVKENKKIKFHQFIRLVYSGKTYTDKLSKTQIMFVTPVEIAQYFNLKNNNNQFDYIIEDTVSYLTESNKNLLFLRTDSSKAKYFPKWLDCSSFVWPFANETANSTIQTYLDFLSIRCR